MLASEPVSGRRTYDLAIVGGGILGLSLAFEIQRRRLGWRVALLRTKNTPAASAAAGAMLSAFGETTAYGLASTPGRKKADWRIRAAQLWPAWAEELNLGGGEGQVRLCKGTVVVLNAISGPLDNRNFESIIGALRDAQAAFEYVDPVKFPGLRPTSPGRPLQAILIPEESFVDAASVIGRLIKRLEDDERTDIFEARCLGIDTLQRQGNSHRIHSDSGSFCASSVVVAGGVESLELLGLGSEAARRIPPLVAGSGCAIVCSRPSRGQSLDVAIRTPNRSFACGLHVLPHNRDGMYIGATNNVQSNPSTRPLVSDVSFLIQCAAQQVDRTLQASELLTILTGWRPVTLDTFPLLGETRVRGLWLMTGTYRDGFHLSPLLAKLTVDAFESGASTLAGGELFRPERPPLTGAVTPSVAIQQGIDNYVGIAFERGAVFPGDGFWEDEFRDSVTRHVKELYARFGSRFLPPPDLLWDIEHSGLGMLLERYHSESENIWPER